MRLFQFGDYHQSKNDEADILDVIKDDSKATNAKGVSSIHGHVVAKGIKTGSMTRKSKPDSASPNGLKLGIRKEGPIASSSNVIGGFNIGLGRKHKDEIDGPRTLDFKHHSVVVIKENKNPNLQTSGSGIWNNGLGFRNLIPKNSFPDFLKDQGLKDPMKGGDFNNESGFSDEDKMVSLDKDINGKIKNLDGSW